MTAIAQKSAVDVHLPSYSGLKVWDKFGTLLLNGLAWLLAFVYLFPMFYMVMTSVKADEQIVSPDSPPWPAQAVTYTYQGQVYVVYNVPTDHGVQQWALVTRRRTFSEFIDPAHPEKGLIRWEGFWRSLKAVYNFHFTFAPFYQVWTAGRFLKAMGNTWIIVGLGTTGALISSILVAYGFARFPVPGGRWLFMLLLASIMLPDKVTFIPTYFIYARVLQWMGTWLPIVVPAFFGNAVMIFLLRQNFKSIPRDIEEAAIIEGAGPLRILISIVLPQAVPTVLTVALLQFFYFWSETRLASLYLAATPALHPVSFWLQWNGSFVLPINLIQASALMVMAVPVLVLLLSQRIFMQGVIVTGTEK